MNFVSIIVPCYNEEKSITYLLDALYKQNYPRHLIEVVIVDGLSSDSTIDEISKYQQKNPDLIVRVINNPKKNIPTAVNIGIKESKGEIIIRMDAHSIPNENYVKYCVENLTNNMAANVGGRWIIVPGAETKIAECISLAAAHPFGVGDAKYRYSQNAGYVDTVPFGSFYKNLIDEIGYFNEDLLANEDYEFNVRIQNAGKKVYFDPRIQTKYIARATWKDLAKQYWRYGFWKLKMLKRFPETIRWRQAIPPLFVAGIMLLIMMSIFSPIALLILTLLLSTYFLVLVIGSLSFVKPKENFFCLIGVPISIMIMHFSWGSGFLFSFFSSQGKK